MISIDDMMVFVTVVRYQSFTKAADELNLGKARVSQIVSRLEDSLGSRLLNRTTRSLSLTDFGARYYDKCLTIQDLANEANSDALNASTDISGVIRVSTSIGSEAHINLLGSFLQRYPEIQLDLIESDSYSNLIDSRCDVAIRASSSLEDSSLHAIQFAHFTDCLCATPEYLAANSHPTTIEDLLKLDWITHEVVHGTKQITLTSPKGQVTKVNKEPRIVVRNTHSLKALVKNNLGFGILPTFVIQKELASGSLLRLLPEIHSKPIPLYAVYQSKMHMPKRVRLFLDYLKTTRWSDETRGQK